MNSKMQKAIKSGKLLELDNLLKKLSSKQKKEVEERVRYIKAAIAVRKLRKQLKLTQQKLAKKMKAKREFISRIESGRQNITLETLYQIAEAAGKEINFQFK